jgi:hypothetical protein
MFKNVNGKNTILEYLGKFAPISKHTQAPPSAKYPTTVRLTGVSYIALPKPPIHIPAQPPIKEDNTLSFIVVGLTSQAFNFSILLLMNFISVTNG